ncbi:MAG: hypothetical protein ACFFBP_18050, partial [Promethearchaeota archaeon]
MITYPDGYNFLSHYFSDLGTFKSIYRVDNTLSRVLFIITCTWWGCTLFFFWAIMPLLFSETKKIKNLSIIGSISGIISSLFLIALAFYGYDLFFEEHGITARMFFILIDLSIMTYSITMLMNKNYPQHNVIGIFSIILSIFTFLFIIHLIPLFHVIMQKIVVYTFIFWINIQVVVIWKKNDK